MTDSILAKLKKISKTNQIVRLLTRHTDGDAYDGVVLKCNSEIIFLQVESNFEFDGIVLLPTKHVKKLRLSDFERSQDRVLRNNRQITKVRRLPWLMKIESAQELLQECLRRKIWPTVETLSKGSTALYIGPITCIDRNFFKLFCYDAAGQWEKDYRLSYKEIFKIELMDRYSRHFNRYMLKENPPKLKVAQR